MQLINLLATAEAAQTDSVDFFLGLLILGFCVVVMLKLLIPKPRPPRNLVIIHHRWWR